MKKMLTVLLVVVLALGMVAGTAFTVLAQGPAKGNPTAANRPQLDLRRGDVISIDATAKSFVVRQSDNTTATITTDNTTRFFVVALTQPQGQPGNRMMPWGNGMMPGNGRMGMGKGFGLQMLPRMGGMGQKGAFTDIAVGDKVMVQVAKGTNQAKAVEIFKIVYQRVNGTVAAFDPVAKTITINVTGGTPVTVKYDDSTGFTLRGSPTLAAGQNVRVVYRISDKLAITVNMVPATAPRAPTATGTKV